VQGVSGGLLSLLVLLRWSVNPLFWARVHGGDFRCQGKSLLPVILGPKEECIHACTADFCSVSGYANSTSLFFRMYIHVYSYDCIFFLFAYSFYSITCWLLFGETDMCCVQMHDSVYAACLFLKPGEHFMFSKSQKADLSIKLPRVGFVDSSTVVLPDHPLTALCSMSVKYRRVRESGHGPRANGCVDSDFGSTLIKTRKSMPGTTVTVLCSFTYQINR
jgi:hypothetical protein